MEEGQEVHLRRDPSSIEAETAKKKLPPLIHTPVVYSNTTDVMGKDLDTKISKGYKYKSFLFLHLKFITTLETCFFPGYTKYLRVLIHLKPF